MADVTYALTWDDTGSKIYETGDKRGVLYVMDATGAYQDGVAWNGIVAVTESNSGADENALWADDIKYASLRSSAEFGATIEAYQCPEEFYICDGSATPVPGVIVNQQGRRGFGFSFTSTQGNDVLGTDYGEKIHLIYNATASPSERAYQTINDSPDAITLSWELTTTPISVTGLKPTAHIVIDSTKFTTQAAKAKYDAFKAIIYGSGQTAARLPLPDEVVSLLTVSNG